MADVEEYADNLIKVAELTEKFNRELDSISGGSFKWSIERIVESYKGMFDRFCPYRVGDKVKLKRTVCPLPDGWRGCGHFLIKGASATVKCRGWGKKGFSFDIEFDVETYIHPISQEEKPTSHKHTYCFGEDMLIKEIK